MLVKFLGPGCKTCVALGKAAQEAIDRLASMPPWRR